MPGKKQPQERGKLRIGDMWNAITIIASSQTNPLKAIAEFIENSIDAHARHIQLVRGRKDGKPYLRITDAWQRYSLIAAGDSGDLDELFARCQHQSFLIFSIDSDVAFYPEEQEEMARILKRSGVSSMRITVHSEKGHDSFLLEPELFTPHLAHTLNGGTPH